VGWLSDTADRSGDPWMGIGLLLVGSAVMATQEVVLRRAMRRSGRVYLRRPAAQGGLVAVPAPA